MLKEEGKGRILQTKTFLFLPSWEVSKLCDGSDILVRRINAVKKHIRQPEQISLCQKDPPYGSFFRSLYQLENASLIYK